MRCGPWSQPATLSTLRCQVEGPERRLAAVRDGLGGGAALDQHCGHGGTAFKRGYVQRGAALCGREMLSISFERIFLILVTYFTKAEYSNL